MSSNTSSSDAVPAAICGLGVGFAVGWIVKDLFFSSPSQVTGTINPRDNTLIVQRDGKPHLRFQFPEGVKDWTCVGYDESPVLTPEPVFQAVTFKRNLTHIKQQA